MAVLLEARGVTKKVGDDDRTLADRPVRVLRVAGTESKLAELPLVEVVILPPHDDLDQPVHLREVSHDGTSTTRQTGG
jgi:hypothetical protein